MKKKKLFKCLVVVVLICITLFSACSNTFAKINEDYGDPKSSYVDGDVEDKLLASVLIDALGSFLYGISSWIESLVQSLFRGITGNDMFPWADRIIFNAIPMLDVNFLNPSDESMFFNGGKETVLATIVRNTYYTIFAIAVGFLSVLVAIMAIKLALSTIAAEKAQYKKAITRWVFTMIMLFIMHFAMSLIFYVNEQIVRVASSIMKDAFEQIPPDSIALEAVTDEDKIDIVKTFVDVPATEEIILADSEKVEIGYRLTRDSFFRECCDKLNTFTNKSAFMLQAINKILSVKNNKSEEEVLLKENEKYSHFNEEVKIDFVKDPFYNFFVQTHVDETPFALDGSYIGGASDESFKTAMSRKIKYNRLVMNMAGALKESNGSSAEIDLIYDMATFFKESAFTYKTSESGNIRGWKPSKVSIQGAILYTIFIFQSLLYFYAYVKRFFFIIMLAIMAPAIVIFDFFAKSVSS